MHVSGASENPQETNAGRAPAWEWAILLGVLLVGFAVIALRRPDAILNPQFYAEDGRVFYGQAHELGALRTLFLPHRGYLVVAQRLGAALGLAAPLAWAPLVFNAFAIAVAALPAVLIASSRFAFLVPHRVHRLLLALLYLVVPNTWAVMGNLTHVMWFLGLLACLVVLAAPPARAAWRAFDVAAVALSGLSGPFGVFLTPVAFLKWRAKPGRWSFLLLGLTALTALVQVLGILTTPKEQGLPPVGFSLLKLGKIFVQRVVYGALFGQAGVADLAKPGLDLLLYREGLAAALAVSLAGLVFVLVKAPLELRLFVLYAGLVFAASLAWPGAVISGTTWFDLLVPAGNGNRYFVIPILAAYASWAWLLSVKPLALRLAGALALACAVAFGVRLDYREPPYRDFNFRGAARRYERAERGQTVPVVAPPGWEFYLTKKGDPAPAGDDACPREVKVEPVILATNQIERDGNVARSTGTDPQLTYALPELGRVCSVRLKFKFSNARNEPALMQVFWADVGRNAIDADERNASDLVVPGPAEQTAIFYVDDTIDALRVDPDVDRCEFELLEMVVTLPASP